MALTPATFVPLGNTSKPGIPSMWSYITQDATGVVDTSGYFNTFGRLLNVGDVILRVTVNGSNVVQSAGWHVVMSVSAAGVVDVSDTTALTITNTD